jgi:hypothetical protein
LPLVREHRRKRLDAEHHARMAALDDAEASVPDLNAVLMLRIGPESGKAGLASTLADEGHRA